MPKALPRCEPRHMAGHRQSNDRCAINKPDNPYSLPHEPGLNIVAQESEEHAAWLIERQHEERRRSLIRRLQHLVEDAKIEGLGIAEALLRKTAEDLIFALQRDKAAKKEPGYKGPFD